MSIYTETISAMDARKSFGQMLEWAFYNNKTFAITRKDKPMAWLVGGEMFRSLFQLIQEDGALQDTLALMLNKEARDAIEQGEQEYSRREGLVPLQDFDKEL